MALAHANMSASEYLLWEREQTERHEFFRGEVFAITGGSLRHSALSMAIGGDLRAAARGTDCRVLSADQRVVVLPDAHYACCAGAWYAGERRPAPGRGRSSGC